jgi:hypothetical protein
LIQAEAHTAPAAADRHTSEPLTLEALAAKLEEHAQTIRYLHSRIDTLSYELLSTADVARLLGVQPRTAKDFVQRGLDAGALVPRTLTGERWAGEGQQRFYRCEIDAYRRRDTRTKRGAPPPRRRRGRPLASRT